MSERPLAMFAQKKESHKMAFFFLCDGKHQGYIKSINKIIFIA